MSSLYLAWALPRLCDRFVVFVGFVFLSFVVLFVWCFGFILFLSDVLTFVKVKRGTEGPIQ